MLRIHKYLLLNTKFQHISKQQYNLHETAYMNTFEQGEQAELLNSKRNR